MNQIFLTRLFTTSLLFISIYVTAKPGPYGFWGVYSCSAAINDKWGIYGDAHYRAYDFTGDPEQQVLRAAFTYNLCPDKSQQIALGYVHVHSEPYTSNSDQKRETNEHRLYQQLMLKQRYGRLYLTHRFRMEERFLADDFKVRLRYFMGENFCLNKKELVAGTLYLSAFNEIFLHVGKPIFDRYRVYGGVGYVISKNLRMEVGNLWQILESTSRPQLQVTICHNFRL